MGLAPHIPESFKGQAWMLLSCTAFVAIWALARHLSATLHPFVIVFFRTLFAILAFLPFLLRHGRQALATRHLPLHLLRGGLSLVATLGIFYSVAHIPLDEAVAISYAAPVFAAVGAVLILKEKVKWRRVIAIAIGLAGILLILRPGFREVTPGVLAAMAGALAVAGSLVVIKRLSETDRPEVIALYALLFVLPGSLIAALPFWTWPGAEELLVLILIGVLVAIGHTALGRAFSHSEATAVLPLDFSRIVLASAVGVLVFSDPIDGFAWAGAAVILASSVYVAHREAVMARRAAKKPARPLPHVP
jgi:drug/metabolite transporter (DMT)-like permease